MLICMATPLHLHSPAHARPSRGCGVTGRVSPATVPRVRVPAPPGPFVCPPCPLVCPLPCPPVCPPGHAPRRGHRGGFPALPPPRGRCNLLQGLKSTDSAVKEKALAEAERRLQEEGGSKEEETKTTVNRTVINTRASGPAEAANADAFLAMLEKDAKERAKQRKRNEQLANALKEKGNEEFRRGDFAGAIQSYSEGLEKLRDKQELYTNRAQAYLKIQEYEKAIGDCEWALKCNGKCIKAYFLMGKAHLALKHYPESRQCYEKMLQVDPQKESLFKACVAEVDSEEKRVKDEERAKKEVQAGNVAALSIKELLQRLSTPGQDILFYTGGIRLLAAVVKDCTEQTLFRTNNGFSILGDNGAVGGCLCAERRSPAEVELCVSLLVLWQAVCAGNEENQRLLLTQPAVSAQLPELLSSGIPEIQRETLALISLYSESERGRKLLVRHQDLSRWLQILLAFVKSSDGRAGRAMNILADLIAEERFKAQCRAQLSTGALPLFTHLLVCARGVDLAALSCAISIMGSLCADPGIRSHMAQSRECWQGCLQLLEGSPEGSTPSYQECVFAVLGLMMNLLLESNGIIQDFAVAITGRCLALLSHQDGRIVTRAIGVLSRVLPASSSAVEEAVKGGVVKKMVKFLKAGGQLTATYGIKTLCICTRSSRQAQEELVKADKRFAVLLRLLRSQEEMVVGNAAFCLSQCLGVPGAGTALLGSNVVLLLLSLAGGEAARTTVQENAAVALGKLCAAEPRHIHQLRKLNGLAILNSSMKYVHSS
ncbi:tetratricopeptide repeat protein 12 isoform X1 [Chiroxiphia lanceolata]|uniref:tetratricopeptide repeat protein 12 isoform X1 n=1 Tax=Chiroxiphia lanceolata TaxID=296741 RepID=UPI0013CF24C6|nr:tetratricopeptide repeat protein 12 isoform X1 [Chiroxiphia lanceolata]